MKLKADIGFTGYVGVASFDSMPFLSSSVIGVICGPDVPIKLNTSNYDGGLPPLFPSSGL